MAENGNGNGINVSRLRIPIAWLGGVAAGMFIAAGLHYNSLARIALLEEFREKVESRFAWRRRDMFEWCLQTEKLNKSWTCWDPYVLPTDNETGPVSYLRPPIWNGVDGR